MPLPELARPPARTPSRAGPGRRAAPGRGPPAGRAPAWTARGERAVRPTSASAPSPAGPAISSTTASRASASPPGEDPELRGVLRPPAPPLARQDGEDAPPAHRLAAPLDGAEAAQDEALAGERRHRRGEAELGEAPMPPGGSSAVPSTSATAQGTWAVPTCRSSRDRWRMGRGAPARSDDLHVEDGGGRHHARVGQRPGRGRWRRPPRPAGSPRCAARPRRAAPPCRGPARCVRAARPPPGDGGTSASASPSETVPERMRPGDHRAEALQREGPVHRQEERSVGGALRDLGGQRGERPPPGAGAPRRSGPRPGRWRRPRGRCRRRRRGSPPRGAEASRRPGRGAGRSSSPPRRRARPRAAGRCRGARGSGA